MNNYQSKAYAELRELARDVERACDHVASGFRGDKFHALCQAIERQERQHRRFVGGSYTFPVRCAVAYFVVRCFNEAVQDKRDSITYADLDGMREDFLAARIIVARDRAAFAPLAEKLATLSAKYDYPDLVDGKRGGQS